MATGLLLGLLLVAGCGRALKGRVIDGPSSVALIVAIGDDRLTQPGVVGVPIKLYSDDGIVIGETISGEDGEFKLSVDNQYSGKFRVRADTDQHLDVNSIVYMPGDEKRLLVILERVVQNDEDGG